MTTHPDSAAAPEDSTDLTTNLYSEDQTGPWLNRRQILVAAGLGAGTLTLAACGSSSTQAAASSTSTSSAAPSSAAPSSAAPSSAAAASGGNTLVALSKVPVAGAVAANDANGKPIIVAQPTAGTAVAFSAICTHMGCPVKVAGAELHCPCHGSKYNALTGAVINGPAPKPLASVPVTVKDGNVVAS